MCIIQYKLTDYTVSDIFEHMSYLMATKNNWTISNQNTEIFCYRGDDKWDDSRFSFSCLGVKEAASM